MLGHDGISEFKGNFMSFIRGKPTLKTLSEFQAAHVILWLAPKLGQEGMRVSRDQLCLEV